MSAGQLLLHQLVALLALLPAHLLAAVRVTLLGAARLHLAARLLALHLHIIIDVSAGPVRQQGALVR